MALFLMASMVSSQTTALATSPSAAPSAAPGLSPAAPAATNTLYIEVVSIRDEPRVGVVKGQAITDYDFLINVDNTGDPTQPRYPDCYPYLDPPDLGFSPGNTLINTNYPANCDWPGIRAVPGYAPIVTQGDETILNAGTGLTLPDGKYLISVMADGYKIGGEHFTMPLPTTAPLQVELHPHPLPDATIRIKVFEDVSPVNGAFDAPGENGLAGFRATIGDPWGEITADIYGNPLCTEYELDINGRPVLDGDGVPIPIPGTGGICLSDANGDIVIPHVGPLRYEVFVVPPDGETWIQTTTLEGSQGWDTWLQENGTGLDNEFVVAGEPFPWTIFGFVRPADNLNDLAVTGSVTGRIVKGAVYTPFNGGLPYYGTQWGGLGGTKITGPIEDGWVALCDLGAGDTAVYVAPANADGTFTIANVPDGNYFFTYWDQKQHHILDWMQVTVSGGQMVDLGTPFLTGWFTFVNGYVFEDLDEDGKRDPGEPGIANYTVVLRDRDNSEIDRGTVAVLTDGAGFYNIEKGYPIGSWMVLEAFNELYETTGVTFQVENQPTETTILGAGVDIGILPMLGHTGRVDWGVRRYQPGTNGGIAGTVFYDTMRAEDDARYAGAEPYQPGIPGLEVNLYATVRDPVTGEFVMAPDGSLQKGHLLATTTTEQWERPVDCQARNADGDPVDQLIFPPSTGGYACLEGPAMGLQFQAGFASVDGNYGLGELQYDPVTGDPLTTTVPLPPGDYLVEIVVPNDSFGRPAFQVTREEDLNMFAGDQFIPQVPPPACAGPLHTVDVAGAGTDNYGPVVLPNGVTVPASTPVENPGYVDAGGSRFEGMQKPLCNVRLVTVQNGRAVAPAFNFFTKVPVPGRWKGYIIDDLNIATDNTVLFLGEKAGVPHAPIGVYDWAMNLVTTVESDIHGVFEVLLPSTATFNAPTPGGIFPGVYYLLGNDPGQPGAFNANYLPQYRTIGASFEIYPGVIEPADLAPTVIGANITGPGSQFHAPPACTLDSGTPQLYVVSRPYVNAAAGGAFTITGAGFGATAGAVTLNDTTVLPVTSWSDTQIAVDIPGGSLAAGTYQLKITGSNGQSTVNGLTFHVLGAGYNPTVFEVGPGRTYSTIQAGIDAASASNGLVVVYPGTPQLWNPDGVYYENVIMYAPIKLQGVGPGGPGVLGSVIDGRGVAGDTPYADQWRTLIAGITWDGNQQIYEGPVVYILAQIGEFTDAFKAAVDGLTIMGGDQQANPNFIQAVGAPEPLQAVTVQGGGIFANAYVNSLQITNNILKSNGGAYGGAVRIGTPHLPGAANDNQNDNVRIAHNRIIHNGGTNLAGGLGIFSGSENYEIAYNDICGNFSGEYGGGISHYGYSPNGSIHHNRVYFNRAYDEAGGIMIAGELPAVSVSLSQGAGPVDVYSNLIQANLGNDDGGGLRFLMAGNFTYNVYNNLIVNNVSTHEGAGISLNDAPDVRAYNNTIMKNITTATARTSNGQPAPAGLSSSRNSALLQATLPSGAPIFSNPLLFNNIFWDNRAGTWNGLGVSGIGLAGDPNPIQQWDLGVSDGSGMLAPKYSVLQSTAGTILDPSNQVGVDPQVVLQYDTSVDVLPWRGGPRLIDTTIVAAEAPPNLMGDYRIAMLGSPALDAGTASLGGVAAPADDIDGLPRPRNAGFDIGASEVPGLPVPVAPVVSIGRSGNDVVLNWPAVSLDIDGQPTTVTGYEVHRHTTDPYFAPGAGTLVWSGALLTYSDVGVLGDETVDHFYLIRALNAVGASAPSNRVGEVEYRLWETNGPDYNWIGQPLDASLVTAANLEAAIEGGSSSAVAVTNISRWNGASQNYTTYSTTPFPNGNFNLAIGGAYRVAINIPATGSGSVVWSLLGAVPDATAFSYTLNETTGTDFNWLLLPLDHSTTVMASALKSDIDLNASPAAVATAISQWNGASQGLTNYTTVPFPTGNFAVMIGRPYRVTINVTVPNITTVWP
jgi:hypothetical protein